MNIDKLHVIEGCVHWCWEVNDKELNEYTPEERREILHKLIDMCNDADIYNMTQEVMKDVCEHHGTYEYDNEPCECCGDYTCEWEWNRQDI